MESVGSTHKQMNQGRCKLEKRRYNLLAVW